MYKAKHIFWTYCT